MHVQRLTLSVFVVRKFRTDSVFIVQDTIETNTSHKPATTRTLTQIETNTSSDDGMPAVRTASGRRGYLLPLSTGNGELHRKLQDYYSRSFGFDRIISQPGTLAHPMSLCDVPSILIPPFRNRRARLNASHVARSATSSIFGNHVLGPKIS